MKYPEQVKDGLKVKDDQEDVVVNGASKRADVEQSLARDNFAYAAEDKLGYNDKFAVNGGGGDGGGVIFTTKL